MAAIMVDDVVTTGASLLDAERALAAAGVGALGAAVLAASPPSGQGERHRDGGYKGPGSRPPIG
jgi:orotate phosphoribosyltransferase